MSRSPSDRRDWHVGPRAGLRPLFELAEDAQSQLDHHLGLGRVLVASRGSVTLGHLQLVPTKQSGEIGLKNMAVVPAQRGTGVARALITAAIHRCGAEGWSRMVVGTGAADTGNLRFRVARHVERLDPSWSCNARDPCRTT